MPNASKLTNTSDAIMTEQGSDDDDDDFHRYRNNTLGEIKLPTITNHLYHQLAYQRLHF